MDEKIIESYRNLLSLLLKSIEVSTYYHFSTSPTVLLTDEIIKKITKKCGEAPMGKKNITVDQLKKYVGTECFIGYWGTIDEENSGGEPLSKTNVLKVLKNHTGDDLKGHYYCFDKKGNPVQELKNGLTFALYDKQTIAKNIADEIKGCFGKELPLGDIYPGETVDAKYLYAVSMYIALNKANHGDEKQLLLDVSNLLINSVTI